MVSIAFNKVSNQAWRLTTLHRSIIHWLLMVGRVWLIQTTTQVKSPLHHQNLQSLNHHNQLQCQITKTYPTMMDKTLMVDNIEDMGEDPDSYKEYANQIIFSSVDPPTAIATEKCSNITINTEKFNVNQIKHELKNCGLKLSRIKICCFNRKQSTWLVICKMWRAKMHHEMVCHCQLTGRFWLQILHCN